jgi:predicted ATPase
MTELLEREPFLDELGALVLETAAGTGRLVLIGGEAGIGKSVLVEALCAACGPAARVLAGACDAISPPRPLGPLLDMARQTGGALHHLLASGSAREPIFTALLDDLAGASQPTVLVFEDVHWADEATLDLLRFLARRVGPLRALVVATYRDDEIGPRHPLRLLLGDLATSRSVRRLTLPPLSLEAVRALASGSALDAAALHRQTAGNPFFVAEALAAGDGGIPATVRDAVLTRTARLSEPAHEALEAAAVLGFRAEATLLTDLLGPRAAALDECVSVGFLRAELDAFSFRHELARQAVLDAIAPHRRANLHRLALETLRTTSNDADSLARLAYHADLAGDREAVLEYAPAAAKRAVELKAHREATEQYARALRWIGESEPAERAALLEGLGQQCYLTDHSAQAVAAWNEAIAIHRRAGNRLKEGEILAWLSRPLWYLGRSPEAEASARESLRVLSGLPPCVELGWAYSDLSRVALNAGNNEAAIA